MKLLSPVMLILILITGCAPPPIATEKAPYEMDGSNMTATAIVAEITQSAEAKAGVAELIQTAIAETAYVDGENVDSDQSIEQPIEIHSDTIEPGTIETISPTLTTVVRIIVSEEVFIVQADQRWQSSNIQVQAGDNILIVYQQGEWTGQSGVGGMSGPDYGAAPENTNPCFPIPGEGSSLIARIGGAGEPFKVGYQYSGQVSTSGELEFQMNDCPQWLYDNEGSMTVEIKQIR